MFNKVIRFFLYALLRLVIGAQVYLLSLLMTSAFICIGYSVADLLCKGYLFTGKFLYIWLIISAVVWLPLYIHVELNAHKLKYKRNDKKSSE